MNNNLQHILNLTVPERIVLVEKIWNSITSEKNNFQLSDEQKKILDHEMEECQKHPDEVLSWEEVKHFVSIKNE